MPSSSSALLCFLVGWDRLFDIFPASTLTLHGQACWWTFWTVGATKLFLRILPSIFYSYFPLPTPFHPHPHLLLSSPCGSSFSSPTCTSPTPPSPLPTTPYLHAWDMGWVGTTLPPYLPFQPHPTGALYPTPIPTTPLPFTLPGLFYLPCHACLLCLHFYVLPTCLVPVTCLLWTGWLDGWVQPALTLIPAATFPHPYQTGFGGAFPI